jgi:hypothetical protein
LDGVPARESEIDRRERRTWANKNGAACFDKVGEFEFLSEPLTMTDMSVRWQTKGAKLELSHIDFRT